MRTSLIQRCLRSGFASFTQEMDRLSQAARKTQGVSQQCLSNQVTSEKNTQRTSGWRILVDLHVEENGNILVVKDKENHVCSEYSIHRLENSNFLFLKKDKKGNLAVPTEEKLLQKGSRYFIAKKTN